ncbi:MAG: hypothetical protein CME71_03200 [Halobacteriovorax sp.]|nr:hypothetical protein [Halobacteriovorax sp.]
MNSDQKIVDKAVKLSLVELVIGSTIHALHLPMGGQLLSLNQGFMLTRFLRDSRGRIAAAKMVMEVSSVASLMKSLAPVGKKLGPMISISMQGFLYMLGILAFGRSLLGQMLGMILLSSWAFVQPFITYYIIYGHDLAKAVDYFVSKNAAFIDIIAYVVLLKCIVAALIPVVIRFISEEKIQKIEEKIETMSVPKKRSKASHSPFKGALLELCRPMFLLSVGLMVTFFLVTGDSAIEILWKVMRAFAVAFAIFYLARNPFIHRQLSKMARKNQVVARLYQLSVDASKRIANLQ